MKRFTLLSFAVFIILSVASAQNSKGKVPVISFDKKEHDFGQFKELEGYKYVEFKFTNTGEAPLWIMSVNSSCGCTTPTFTKDTLAPGKSGVVKVQFDPKDRPGFFSKSITVASNSEQVFTNLVIKGDVIPKEPALDEKYPVKIGNARFDANHLAFGRVYTNISQDTAYSRMYNEGTKALTITGFNMNSGVKIVASKMIIQPGEYVTLVGFLDPAKVKDYGTVLLSGEILTDDEYDAKKVFYVTAEILEFFPVMDKKAKEKAPKIEFSKTVHDFGKIKQGEVITVTYEFENKGKSDLIIRKTKASCGCTASEPEKKLLKKGEKSKINVTYNSAGKSGFENKTITVISNDPSTPSVVLIIKGQIDSSK